MPGSTPGDQVPSELEVERAASAHWRRLAQQRSVELTRLSRRRGVRLALGIERRLAPVTGPARRWVARARARGELVALRAGALTRRARTEDLTQAVALLPEPPLDGRRLLVAVVGGRATGPSDAAASVDAIAVAGGAGAAAAVRDALQGSNHDLVGLRLDGAEVVGAAPAFWGRLVAAVGDGVVAATALAVHPQRSHTEATSHDGRVRAAGLAVRLADDGVPALVGRDAGDPPNPSGPVEVVDAASSACMVVDRAAYDAAGGLPGGTDLDVAVTRLCVELAARGGATVVVPSAVVVDHRPVATRAALRGTVARDDPAWLDALDAAGPALRRLASPLDAGRLRFTITVAAPSAKVAPRWGDWHLGEGLAGALRRLGHEACVQTADRADGAVGRTGDVHVVVRGVQPVRRTAGQRHVLWIISHPEAVDDAELDAADLVVVASRSFAEHLRGRTATPVEVLLQATDHHRFRPSGSAPTDGRVVVVAKAREVYRTAVRDAVDAGLRPRVYGSGWEGLVDPDLVVASHVPNEELPAVYGSAAVVLNDHWQTMQTWGFVSNRVFDVLACGVPLISDPVPGMAELLDGAVLEYHGVDELQTLVAQVLAEPEAARARAERGRQAVLRAHTFDHRARELLTLLGL